MAFHGLFVGINRYQSHRINWLSCACRDATALHALMTDTLGGDSELLLDEKATRQAICEQLERLEKCKADDVVVIAFSGHGSETHELVTYDADPDDLHKTAITLSELTDWFSGIPARHVICILDCCFSGGMGAKVLHVEASSRKMDSAEEALKQLSGKGKLILTASTASQEAWEIGRVGHGLLTHHLLNALQGAEEVGKNGKVSVYKLLDYVTTQVRDGAAVFGKKQDPTLRGTLDGELTWPVFKPGTLYHAAFPERGRPSVTADVQSLKVYGFPPELLNVWAVSIPGLNQLQLDAVNEFRVLDGEHLVVSAPTSSGKTMIGELASLKGALEGRRAIFLLPLKALVNDKYRQFNELYGGFGIRTIRATGDTSEFSEDIPALMRGQYDICLMTYEKFSALVLASPHILEQAGIVVVDEVQMLADKSRGMNLEFILTLLRMRRRQGIEPQLIALSAVIGDTNGLERWLGARLLRREERPVPLDEGIIRADGSFRYIESDTKEEKLTGNYVQRVFRKGSSQDWVIPLVRRLVDEGKQVIVFRELRGKARGTANYLAQELGLPSATTALAELPATDLSIVSETLRQTLSGGVAFHISDLSAEERAVVEGQFRAPNSQIRVVAATTTLAMGVNTPTEAVVVVGLEHPGPSPTAYSVAEYKNIVGRAGRLGYTKGRGTSYLIAVDSREEHHVWSHYVMGPPEALESRFLDETTDPRSLIVRTLVGAKRTSGDSLVGLSADDIVDFLEGSFGAYQQGVEAGGWRWNRNDLVAALVDLESHNLVHRTEDDLYELTELGWLAGQGGVEVETIIRVVDTVGALTPDAISDPTLLTVTQLTTELDNVFFPVNRKGHRKEYETWSSELRRQRVPDRVLSQLQRKVQQEEQAAMRAKRAAACLLWMSDIDLAETENILTKHGGRFDGTAGPTRSVASRTQDLLPTVARVCEILHKDLPLSERISRLLARLEVGAPSAMTDVTMVLGSRLNRGDYRELLKAGFSSIDAIDGCDDDKLEMLLGNDRRKVSEVRKAIVEYTSKDRTATPAVPLIPDYEK